MADPLLLFALRQVMNAKTASTKKLAKHLAEHVIAKTARLGSSRFQSALQDFSGYRNPMKPDFGLDLLGSDAGEGVNTGAPVNVDPYGRFRGGRQMPWSQSQELGPFGAASHSPYLRGVNQNLPTSALQSSQAAVPPPTPPFHLNNGLGHFPTPSPSAPAGGSSYQLNSPQPGRPPAPYQLNQPQQGRPPAPYQLNQPEQGGPPAPYQLNQPQQGRPPAPYQLNRPEQGNPPVPRQEGAHRSAGSDVKGLVRRSTDATTRALADAAANAARVAGTADTERIGANTRGIEETRDRIGNIPTRVAEGSDRYTDAMRQADEAARQAAANRFDAQNTGYRARTESLNQSADQAKARADQTEQFLQQQRSPRNEAGSRLSGGAYSPYGGRDADFHRQAVAAREARDRQQAKEFQEGRERQRQHQAELARMVSSNAPMSQEQAVQRGRDVQAELRRLSRQQNRLRDQWRQGGGIENGPFMSQRDFFRQQAENMSPEARALVNQNYGMNI